MNKVLPLKFFRRPALKVAHGLLGKFLVHKIGQKEIAVMITEVEAYDGPKDKASHASRGLTERNAIMFGAGGNFYVYLCYGMYEMLNIVTGQKDYPAAILLRGAITPPFQGGDGGGVLVAMGCVSNSPLERGGRRPGCVKVLDGPGKLTKFLKITRDFNKKPATKETGLWFEDRGLKIPERLIKRTPRIGVNYAGPVWKNKKYRFLISPHYFLLSGKKNKKPALKVERV